MPKKAPLAGLILLGTCRCIDEKFCKPTFDGLLVNPTARVALQSVCSDHCHSDMQYLWSITTTEGQPVVEEMTCSKDSCPPGEQKYWHLRWHNFIIIRKLITCVVLQGKSHVYLYEVAYATWQGSSLSWKLYAISLSGYDEVWETITFRRFIVVKPQRSRFCKDLNQLNFDSWSLMKAKLPHSFYNPTSTQWQRSILTLMELTLLIC